MSIRTCPQCGRLSFEEDLQSAHLCRLTGPVAHHGERLDLDAQGDPPGARFWRKQQRASRELPGRGSQAWPRVPDVVRLSGR